jgi:hypothetical protein
MSYDDPPPPPQKQPRGCFFYGCLFSVILLVVLVVVIGGSLYAVFRYAVNTAKEYTDTVAVVMPPVKMPEPQRVVLRAKVEDFGKGLDARRATPPIVLTADDLNALADDNPMFKGKVHIDIVGDKVTAKISVPLSQMGLDFAELKGRYLNGSAVLRVSLKDGVLDVRADSVEARGKPLPPALTKAFRDQNVLEKSLDDPKARMAIDKLESVVVKDGTVILTPRPAAKPAPALNDTPPKDAAPKDAAEQPAKP